MKRIIEHRSVIKSSYRSIYIISPNCVPVSVPDFKVKKPTIGLEFMIRGRQGKRSYRLPKEGSYLGLGNLGQQGLLRVLLANL